MNRLSILFLILLSYFSISSQNLVPNPGFEIFSACPTSVAQTTLATGWSGPMAHFGSADYFNTCGSGMVAVPNNVFGIQTPNTGNGYMGLCLKYNATPEFREYIQIQLSQPLLANQCYSVSYYYSLSDQQYATDRMGIYFSANPVMGTFSYLPLPFVPQIQNTLGNYLTNTSGWTKITSSFVASGGEQYFLLGNFYDDANTSTVISNNGATYSTAYIYIDDVSVESCTGNNALSASSNQTICAGQNASISASGGNGTYWWATSLHSSDTISTNASLIVSPLTTTSYIVTSNGTSKTVTITVNENPSVNLGNNITKCINEDKTLNAYSANCSYVWSTGATTSSIPINLPGTYSVTVTNSFGCVSIDSVHVIEEDCTYSLEMPNVFTPNDDNTNDLFIPTSYKNIKSASILIYNRWGNLIYSSSNMTDGWNGKYNNNPSPSGTYFWIINYENNQDTKFTLKGFLSLFRD